MSKRVCLPRGVVGLLAVGLVVAGTMMAGCNEEFVGCVDPCGCVLAAAYQGEAETFYVEISNDCGLITTLGPFDTLGEAEEAFELF